MTFKPVRMFYFILIICNSLWTQQLPTFSQKISIENSYREKVVSAVSRLVGRDNIIVIVNIDFSTVGQSLKKTAGGQSGQSSSNGYTPIPGLPTVPSQDVSSSNTTRGSTWRGVGTYSIARVEVNIDLNEELATGSVKQEIKSLVETAIPETRGCDDCIKIEALQYPQSEKSSLEQQLKELQKNVSDLKSEEKRLEENQRKVVLQTLEKRYEDVKKQLTTIQNREQLRGNLKREQDSIRLANALEDEKYRQDQLLKEKEESEKKLERMMNSKIRSDSLIINEAMGMYKSVMKQKGGGDYDNEALLGMQIGNSNAGILNAIVFLLLIIGFIILLYFALNKKNKPIYLKPATKNKPIKEGKTEDNSSSLPPTPAQPHDEDSIRSELRSLRQTAISLSVGEKENASALIKEWLEDNPDKAENSVEE